MIIIIIFIPILLCASAKENKKRCKIYFYDKSLSVACKNGIFVGSIKGNIVSFKGIPFA